MKTLKRSLIILLAVCMLSLSACTSPAGHGAVNLTAGVKAGAAETRRPDEAFVRGGTAFAAELFKSCYGGNNTFVSPLSVMLALAMTANGAAGQTRDEMLAVLAGGAELEDLNEYLAYMLAAMPEDERCRLIPANSIWIRESYEVKESFLETCGGLYGADVFRAPFDDGTVRDINAWVKENTDGMIRELLQNISDDTELYLINTLMFEAEWAHKYNAEEVRSADFHPENGKAHKVTMMYSTEDTYLESAGAVGFIKPYAFIDGTRFGFCALLPEEGTSLDDFIGSLNGDTLFELLHSGTEAKVNAGIPKFSAEWEATLNDQLIAMGMPTAFGSGADFSEMSPTKLWIGEVRHKTFIEVAEKGTRAGAATSVAMKDGAMPVFDKPREVILDRPFVYMIIDFTTMLPVFIGAAADIN